MQVKKFGFHGRTKYTHLVDQDTSGLSRVPPAGPGAGPGGRQDNKPRGDAPRWIKMQPKHRIAGTGDDLSRPSRKTKM